MCDVRSVPINISKLFSKISRVHSYSTRSLPSEHFYTKQSALNIQGKDFSRVGVYNWNEIPINLRSLPKNPFKISIKENYSKFNYSRSQNTARSRNQSKLQDLEVFARSQAREKIINKM